MPRPTHKPPQPSWRPGAGILQEDEQPSERAGSLGFTGEPSSLVNTESHPSAQTPGSRGWAGGGSAGLAHPELSRFSEQDKPVGA